MDGLENVILDYLKSSSAKQGFETPKQIANAINPNANSDFEKQVERTLLFMSFSDLFDIKEDKQADVVRYSISSTTQKAGKGSAFRKNFEE